MQNRKRAFPNSQVYCSYLGTPPKSSTEDEGQKSSSAGDENGMPVRKRMRTDSFEKQSSAQQDQNSESFRESSTDDEIKRSSLVAGQKRKSSPATSLIDNNQPEERELPVRKKKRMTGAIFERDRQVQSAPAEVHFSLVICRESRDSSVDLTRDGQFTSSASDSDDSSVDLTRDGQFISSASDSDDSSVDLTRDGQFISSASDSDDSSVDLTRDGQFISSASDSRDSSVDLTRDDDILSRYEMGRLLGQGSFGEVYEGTRLEDGLKVAVKIAKKTANIKYISIPGHPQPLPLEVGLLILVNAKPKAPEIIELLDWQDQAERYIMILERPSPCQDLFDYMASHGDTIDEDTARCILMQITKAARVCFQHGVFHRDIKLENLLINTDTLQVKLIDFGCGDILQESGYEIFAGTEAYCPPEFNTTRKYHGKPATVWSLGVLLFTLVCGNYPHWSELSLMEDGLWYRPDLSNECCNLIQALLRPCPTDRMDLRDIIFHKWFTVTE